MVIHGIGWLAALLLLIGLIRWSWQRSPLIGLFVLVGVLARTIAGMALFWISLFHLPILTNLQSGNGFWVLALDGMSYYGSARMALEHGLSTISSASPSPAYVRLLACALRVWGESPLTAVFLNAMAYVLSCTLCVLMWPRRPDGGAGRSLAIAVAALSFTPSLLLASTQPLKDQVFAFAVVAAIACIQAGSAALTSGGRDAPARYSVAFAGAAIAVYALSGIRAYYGVMIVLTMAGTLGLVTLALPLRRWALHIAATAAATALLWIAFAAGAGPYAAPYEHIVSTTLHLQYQEPAAPLDTAREGFATTGGGTNIVRHHAGAEDMRERAVDEATGLMTLFVPISILRHLSLVDIAGGRGLLAITDVETLFLDVTIAMQLWLVWRQWTRRRGDVAFLIFTCALAAAVMLPMAYVVTNYGTLFRMRVMYAIPLWLSGAAVAGSDSRQRRDHAIGPVGM